MNLKNHISTLSLLIFTQLILVFQGYATHIVGGSLNYVHNGGSSYTITLKLYRDCGPGTAGFPNSVNIDVLGLNGQEFSPSKDISMSLSSITPVTATLDPCAIPPSPMPCVEEGIYTKTVNNLPAVPGGYHLYFQIVARNLSIVNVNTACNCIGESFYAFIPGATPFWQEDFSISNGSTVDNGPTPWSIAYNPSAPATAEVNNGNFYIQGSNNSGVTLSTGIIDISSYTTGVDLSVALSESGNLDNSDNISVYYALDGGAPILFSNNGSTFNDFGSLTASDNGIIGNNLQIIVEVTYNSNSPSNEVYFINDISLSSGGISNSNPEFSYFPPLFLCVNQPFTFDHSAVDIDGDSLVYSFYNPYNGDNGNGPLDPTFSGNTANFTPVVWEPGFSTNDALGSGNLTIDAATGVMTGIPNMLGQFVVGVKVQEYRDGVLVSETLRDFQFNVINCPQPNPPIAGSNIVINDGCSESFTASGFIESTVTWTSVAPGTPGDYDNYLSCTSGCLDPLVSSIGTPPAYIDFQICGTASACNAAFSCDTVRVTFNPSLSVMINPQVPTICFGQTSADLTAVGSGGTPPYTYLWNNVNPSQTIVVGAGTYTVQMWDASGCPPTTDQVTVIAYTQPIEANAGPDDTVCIQSPLVELNGQINGALGGLWSGGNGTFSPNDSALTNLFYSPTPAELTAGSVDLYLTTTGTGGCQPDTDTITIYFQDFNGVPTFNNTDVSCFGLSDGEVSIQMIGGNTPYTYTWNTIPTQTNSMISSLPIGSYTVAVEDGIGCVEQFTTSITQPTPLTIDNSASNITCNGGSDGEIIISTYGGTAPYFFNWQSLATTDSIASNLGVGTYICDVTDNNACTTSDTVTLTEPQPIVLSFDSTNVSCFGGSDGTATVSATGGTGNISFNWTTSGATNNTITGLSVGTYEVIATDNNACSSVANVTISEPLAPISAVDNIVNVPCYGTATGEIQVTVAGGTSPYSYSWATLTDTTAIVSNLIAGNYNLAITDNNGCLENFFYTVTQAPQLSVSTTANDVYCFGGSDGEATVFASGGTSGYTYSWTFNASTTANATGYQAGSYSVDVTDANGCIETSNFAINEPSAPLSITSTVNNVSCNNGSDGSITVVTSGGTSPYTYSWLPLGQSTASISNLSAGTYTVEIEDANGCTDNYSFTITEPDPIVITLTNQDINCFGGSDGQIFSNVSGGTAPYTYQWNNAQTTPNAIGLTVGNYTVLITDNLGCIDSAGISVSEPTALQTVTSSTSTSCFGSADGSANVIATFGTAPYTYSWSSCVCTNSTLNNVVAGMYYVTVTDAKGCSKIDSAEVLEPDAITVNTVQIGDVNCFGGSDGFASVSATGGTPNYSYFWPFNSTTSSTTTGLPTGNYSVNVTDQNGCTGTGSITISEPTVLIASTSFTEPTCNSGSDGASSVSVSGGTTPYSYQWTPGNGTGSSYSGLTAGSYTVTVTDANNCTVSSTAVVTEPAPIVLNNTSVNSDCGLPNGIATVTVTSGGSSPFAYSWNPGGQTTSVATGLLSGNYTVTVTDANGCTATGVSSVNDNVAATLAVSTDQNVSCYGGNDGGATVTTTGGIGPFTYQWLPSGETTQSAVSLPAGTNSVNVYASNGCISSTSVTLTQPTQIHATLAKTNVSCNGGSDGTAAVAATGGAGSYTYNWSPSGGTGVSESGLSAGWQYITITDLNSCSTTDSIFITEPATTLSISTTTSDVSCFGGSNGTANVSASGGTSPYSYVWTPVNVSSASVSSLSAGNYTIAVTDSKGCLASEVVTINEPTALTSTLASNNAFCGLANGMAYVSVTGGTGAYNYAWTPAGGTSDTAYNLIAGTYNVHITDGNGCALDETVNVVNDAKPIASLVSQSNVSCYGGNDGTATVSVVSGSGPFTYQWYPFGGTSDVATGLTAGNFYAIVTDANGCTSDPVFTQYVTEPYPLVLNISETPTQCFGGNDGEVSVSINGGTSGYNTLWSDGTTGTLTLTNQSASTGTITVTDANGCIADSAYTITEPAQVQASNSVNNNVSCFGGSDGEAQITASGGTPGYIYSWDAGVYNSPNVSTLSFGTYNVVVTDAHGCTSNTTVTISQPSNALSVTQVISQNSCFGSNNSSITLTPTGGTPNYAYQWSPNGNTTQTISNLAPGNYVANITDANSCSTSISAQITQPTELTGNLVITHPSCGLSNGSISAMISGGTPPYSYSWNASAVNASQITGLTPGNYFVTVSDAHNCTVVLNASLTNIPGPIGSLASSTDASCYGFSDGEATINISSGTMPYSVQWYPYGGNSVTGTQLAVGNYLAIVTDSLSCKDTVEVVIDQPQILLLNLDSLADAKCFGHTDGYIEVSAVGGTAPYSYTWSDALHTGPIGNDLVANTYTIIASDIQGCTTNMTYTIDEPDDLFSQFTMVSMPTCYLADNGQATVIVSGGTPSYSYLWSDGQTGNTAYALEADTYTVDITDINGCSKTDTIEITEPYEIITTTSNNDTICFGDMANLTASATGGNGNFSFAWQPTGAINNGNYSVSPTESTDYYVQAFDQYGCPGNISGVSVIVYNFDPADVSLTVSDSLICPGQYVVLTADININQNDTLIFNWNNNLGTDQGPFVVYPSDSSTYTLEVTNGCGQTGTYEVDVNYNDPPVVNFEILNDTVCNPELIIFSDSSYSSDPQDLLHIWEWDFGDGSNSYLQSPTHLYQTPGTYNVTLTVSSGNGCTNSNVQNPATVVVYPTPIASFSLNQTVFEIPIETMVGTNQSVDATEYYWSFGDGNSSYDVDISYLYTTIGDYQVTLVAANEFGCSDTAYQEVITNSTLVFPNAFTPNTDGPSGGIYDVMSLNNDIFFPYTSGVTEFQILIFNRWGELIFESNDINIGWDGYYNGELCQQGVYAFKAFAILNNGERYQQIGNVTLLRIDD